MKEIDLICGFCLAQDNYAKGRKTWLALKHHLVDTRCYCSFILFIYLFFLHLLFSSSPVSRIQWKTKYTKSLPSQSYSFSLRKSIPILICMLHHEMKKNKIRWIMIGGIGLSEVTLTGYESSLSEGRASLTKGQKQKPCRQMIVAGSRSCVRDRIGHAGRAANPSFCFEWDGKPQPARRHTMAFCKAPSRHCEDRLWGAESASAETGYEAMVGTVVVTGCCGIQRDRGGSRKCHRIPADHWKVESQTFGGLHLIF